MNRSKILKWHLKEIFYRHPHLSPDPFSKNKTEDSPHSLTGQEAITGQIERIHYNQPVMIMHVDIQHGITDVPLIQVQLVMVINMALLINHILVSRTLPRNFNHLEHIT